MRSSSKDELRKIDETDDLHISPFREDGATYGTPTWIWSVVVDDGLCVRAYSAPPSRWYKAAMPQSRALGSSTSLAIVLCVLGPFSLSTNTSLWGQSVEESNSPSQQQRFTQFVAEGSQALQQGNNIAAEHAFREALTLDPGVPGSFCTSGDETDWYERSGRWRRGRSIQLSKL